MKAPGEYDPKLAREKFERVAKLMTDAGWLSSFGHTSKSFAISPTPKGAERLDRLRKYLDEIHFTDFDGNDFFALVLVLHTHGPNR